MLIRSHLHIPRGVGANYSGKFTFPVLVHCSIFADNQGVTGCELDTSLGSLPPLSMNEEGREHQFLLGAVSEENLMVSVSPSSGTRQSIPGVSLATPHSYAQSHPLRSAQDVL